MNMNIEGGKWRGELEMMETLNLKVSANTMYQYHRISARIDPIKLKEIMKCHFANFSKIIHTLSKG